MSYIIGEYYCKKINKPYTLNEDQDAWVARIHYKGKKTKWKDVIEVRAFYKDDLKKLVKTILHSLNSMVDEET